MDPFLLISIAAFIGVAALIGGAAFVMRDFGSTTTESRLEALTGKKSRSKEVKGITKEDLAREGLGGAGNSLANRVISLSLLLEQSDAPIKAEGFFSMTVGCAVLGGVLAWAAGSPAPLYPVAALLFSLIPFGWLWFRRRARFKKFAKQLPDALELIARALRSGHSLASGLFVVVEEMPAPISTEFGMAYEEQNLGVPLEQALKDMVKRMPNMDLKFFVTAVAIQRQAGGDLAEILDKIGHIIRERFKIMGQVQALTGEGRISGIILMALPIGLFFAVYYLNREYVMQLFTDPLGKKMVALAIFLQMLGAYWINKIVKIKI